MRKQMVQQNQMPFIALKNKWGMGGGTAVVSLVFLSTILHVIFSSLSTLGIALSVAVIKT